MSAAGKVGAKGGAKTAAPPQTKQAHKGADKAQRQGKGAPDNDANDEVGIRNSVLALMETTCRTEEDVCSALHDCDNDIVKACNMLLEERDNSQGQWQTNEKKKKKAAGGPTPNAGGPGAEKEEDWGVPAEKAPQGPAGGPGNHSNSRDNRRGRSSGRPYRGRGDAHGNGDDPEGHMRGGGPRRGGPGRGGARGGGRGAGRGGHGSRPPRTTRPAQEPEEDWGDNTPAQNNQQTDDWDNEEWTGSLADTKVFTPSSAVETSNAAGAPDANGQPTNPAADQSSVHHSGMNNLQDGNDYSKAIGGGVMGADSTSTPPLMSSIPQDPAIYAYTNSTHHLPKAQSPVAMSVTGVLSAAQSQYLSQLTQKSEPLKQDRGMLNSQVYSTNYGVYGNDLTAQRKPIQRARVPPPSKIPASAVEMPGDLGSSSIGMLDVQFGALDFGPDTSSFLTDSVSSSAPSSVTNTDKYNSTSNSLEHVLSESANGSVLSNDVSAYSTSTTRNAQMITDSLSSGVNSEQSGAGSNSQYATRSAASNVSSSHVPQLTTVSGLESQLTGKSSGVSDISSQQSTYSTYPGQTGTYGVTQPAKQAYHTHHGYPANPYAQVNSSATSFTAASTIASASAYPPSNTLNQYQQPLNSYQSSSVYGGSGLYTASNVPYNNYQTLQNSSNKITSKESQYDSAVTSANLSNSQATQSTQSSTKISSTSSKTNSSSSTSVMNSASAGTGSHVGAATVMGQYMISQPYYAQQPLPYTYEEVQIMQQRLPHHLPSGYYEVGYGTGGGAAAAGARDAPLTSFAGSLAAGTAEGRFGRAEAPSPQAVAGGGAGAGAAQPPQTALPYYYAAYGANMLPGSFQPYGTQPIYPIATAGGTGSSSYGSGKGVGGAGTYVGGVGAYGAPAPAAAPPPQAYETVQQQPSQPLNHQQDYKSGGYSSSQQSSVGKQGVNNSNSAGTDMNNSMYGGKSHVSLGKVNSYDKAYHSATPPPPFGLGGAAGGVAGAGGYPAPLYIPHTAMPPPPQQHQMDGRVSNNHRRDNGTNNSRGGTGGQTKQGSAAKQGYSPSYWTPN